jgi:SulP family sulfate permease
MKRINLSRWLPILDWGRHYQKENLPGDFTAGMIVASLLIPQSMAYALLAGLPAQVGLYASIVPQIIYALLGTSRLLSVAPVAVDSLMVATAVGAIATAGTPEYISFALLLALLVGVINMLMGVLRLGFLTNFLSQAVISGFISAAAILIGFSQLKHLLGLQIPQTESFWQLLTYLGQGLASTNGVTLCIGIASILILLYSKRGLASQLQRRGWSQTLTVPVTKSAPLLVVIISSLVVWQLHLDQIAGVRVVGEIPTGLFPLTIPNLDGVPTLLPAAVAISFVGFMEAYGVGKYLASQRREKVDANQELIALGAANLGAAFSGGYPVTGGLSRSVVNFSANAQTPLASIITAVIITLTVLFLTPLFYFLPQASLAAIILVAVSNLLDLATLKRLWIYNKADAIAWLTTFVAVLATRVEIGILIGAGMSILLHLWRTSRPHVAIVGRLGDTEHFRNVQRHPVTTYPHILAVRIDASLYFVNTKFLEDYILQAVSEHPEVQHLVLVCSAVNFIDGSALETLKRLIIDLKTRGVEFYLSEVKGPVLDQLQRAGFVEEVGQDHLFLTTDQAVRTLVNRTSSSISLSG